MLQNDAAQTAAAVLNVVHYCSFEQYIELHQQLKTETIMISMTGMKMLNISIPSVLLRGRDTAEVPPTTWFAEDTRVVPWPSRADVAANLLRQLLKNCPAATHYVSVATPGSPRKRLGHCCPAICKTSTSVTKHWYLKEKYQWNNKQPKHVHHWQHFTGIFQSCMQNKTKIINKY